MCLQPSALWKKRWGQGLEGSLMCWLDLAFMFPCFSCLLIIILLLGNKSYNPRLANTDADGYELHAIGWEYGSWIFSLSPPCIQCWIWLGYSTSPWEKELKTLKLKRKQRRTSQRLFLWGEKAHTPKTKTTAITSPGLGKAVSRSLPSSLENHAPAFLQWLQTSYFCHWKKRETFI